MSNQEVLMERLKRKLAKRDANILALQRRIADLETALATQYLDSKRLPIDVQRAVQRALCNVRMIPVLGLGLEDRILEVKTTPAPDAVKG